MSVGLVAGRAAFARSVEAFSAAVDGLSEWELLGSSRCHGWTRLDVGAHVLAGWQEALGGMACPTRDHPTTDAASFWTAFAEANADEDPVAVVMAQRRRSDAHSRPDAMRAQLRDVAATAVRAAHAMADRPVWWAGEVFTAGDFLATWAVEDVVHQLDLGLPPGVGPPTPPDALTLARRTAEALVGRPLPSGWDDATAVLVATGRLPVPAEAAHLGARLPAFG